MQNILFIVPRYKIYGGQGQYIMPMGILYVSSALKQSKVANVFTLNMNHIEGEEEDILIAYFNKNKINIVAIGGLSGEFCDIYRVIELSKNIDATIKVIVGGGIITATPEVAMNALQYADYGVIGEGEKTIVELLSSLNNGISAETVKGIIYKVDNGYVKTGKRREIADLDTLPLPDYEGFNYKKYLESNPDVSDSGKSYSQVSVIGGRSCKYNCTFCFHPSGSTYRQRSIESIFTEIDYLVNNYEISYVALREELFATDNKRVQEFCTRVENYDFDWSIQLRIDSINTDLVNMLKTTRCRYVFVGIESAHNEILNSMRKGITLQQIEYALELLTEAGLNTRSGIILGDKMETKQTAMWTYNWYQENKSKYRMFLDMIIAFPGSNLYDSACSNGIIPDQIQFLRDGCPIINISKLLDDEFQDLVAMVESQNKRRYYVIKYK